MNISKEHTIGSIAAQDYRAADVFEQAGIDFCCKGDRSIAAACKEKKIPVEKLISRLQQAVEAPDDKERPVINYPSWPLDLLADYIEKKHHRYVSSQIPIIKSFLEKIIQVHGASHPELSAIKKQFDACAGELTSHMKKEELLLFPFIRKMVEATQTGTKNATPAFGTVQNPIRMMMHEHDTEGERFRRIKELSGGYTMPEDACNTYKVAFASLHAFEEDLHLHIHLENNILFPQSMKLEQSLTGN
jgi:regulator of cell morphogenesis and NO signaling